VARAETDCRRDAEEVGGWAVGGVVVGIVGHVWRPNMASMVGRSAAPRRIERKPAGRSDYMNDFLVKETGMKSKETRKFDPCRDSSSCQKPNAIVRERVAGEVSILKLGNSRTAILRS